MADIEKNYVIKQKTEDGTLTLFPQTKAENVILDNTAAGMSATNVQEAFKEVMETLDGVTGGGVVTGVKGENEEQYRKGQVNITRENIGLGNVDNTSDLEKPISTATQDALDLKADKTELSNYIPVSQKGSPSGVASLDESGKVPAAQLPSYVDDVIDGTYISETVFNDTLGSPVTPESGKIYIDTLTNKQYRWSGSKYAEISSSLALGETSSTAYAGDKGKKNADDIAAIIAGTQKVGNSINSDNASNVKTTINGKNITDIFEEDGITAKKATFATSSQEANHATSSDSANTASKLATAQQIELTGDITGSANFDGSAPASISTTLKNSGVSAGAYSVVNVNEKGIVTQGGQIIEVGESGQKTPSESLAIGGIFFQEI